MEKILSVEEKIRRAEEIYERRRNQTYTANTATVNVSGRDRDFKLLKKMTIQVLICMLIYFIFYLIQTTNYVFSATTLNTTRDLLNYDINVKELYNEIKNNFVVENSSGENLQEENTVNNTENEDKKEEKNVVETNNEKVDEEQNSSKNEAELTVEESLEEVKLEEEPQITIAEEILNNYSIIKPTNVGFISSEFGTREPDGIVTPYHNGIDIAVVTGTDIYSAIDGEVILATSSSSYGNYIKVKNGDLVTLYAHCSKLCIEQGENVNQGDKIAESGQTGNATGPHLHFEVIYKDEYVNPRDVLNFD